MDKLKELQRLCTNSITIMINDHKDVYDSAEKHMDQAFMMDKGLREEIGEDVLSKIIATDTVIMVQAYPQSSVGFYHTYHYDLDMALDIIIKSITE